MTKHIRRSVSHMYGIQLINMLLLLLLHCYCYLNHCILYLTFIGDFEPSSNHYFSNRKWLDVLTLTCCAALCFCFWCRETFAINPRVTASKTSCFFLLIPVWVTPNNFALSLLGPRDKTAPATPIFLESPSRRLGGVHIFTVQYSGLYKCKGE